MNELTVTRQWAMPNGKTFTIKPIRNAVRDECLDAYARSGNDAVIVDPFAREAQYGTITNDLNPEYSTDYHMDALEFLKTIPTESADLVLYDPPYSITQAAQLYKSYGKDKLEINVSNMAYWARCKDEMARITKRGGLFCVAVGTRTDLEKGAASRWRKSSSFRMAARRTTRS